MKKRRMGTISSKNGRFYPSVTIPDPEGGSGRRVSLGGFDTSDQAERAIAAAITDLDRGSFTAPSTLTLGAFMERWLVTHELFVRPSTIQSYRNLFRYYVQPYPIANHRLSSLTSLKIQALYVHLSKCGKKDGSPLASKSVRGVHVMLHRALEEAVDSGLILRNPTPRRGPKVNSGERPSLSVPEIRTLLAPGHLCLGFAIVLRLAVLAGLRRGEIAGLRWEDVDLDQGSIVVRRNRAVVSGNVVEGPTKTPASSATVFIDATSRAMLRQHKEAREVVIERPPDPGEYILCLADGRPIHPDRLTKMVHDLVRDLGLPPVTLHGLRHSYGSGLASTGEHMKVVQDAMRLTSIRVAADVYTHLDPAIGASVNDRLARAVGGE